MRKLKTILISDEEGNSSSHQLPQLQPSREIQNTYNQSIDTPSWVVSHINSRQSLKSNKGYKNLATMLTPVKLKLYQQNHNRSESVA